jgi:RNA polymerase sigma factor (sigma-70 family)
MSDVDLVARAEHVDLEAFTILYERYSRCARNVGFSVTHSRTLSEDTVSETFLKLAEGRWRANPSIVTTDGRIDGIVKAIAYYSALKLRYHYAPEPGIAVEHIEWYALRSKEPDPETALIRRELRECLWRSLDALPLQYRRVAYLRYVEELCGPDIAERVGVKACTIPGYLGVIRAKLRADLAPYIAIAPPNSRSRGGHRRFARRFAEPVH